MTKSRYIAIEGVIGVGKTTLARYLSQDLEAGLLLEVFEENPFLADFYADRQQFAFQTQVFFLLSRYRHQHQQIPRLLAQGDMVSDYTFAKDRIFAQVNLSGDEYDTYWSLHQELAANIAQPDLIVYLDADIETILQRIAVRDRSYERQMEPAYLDLLADAYGSFLTDCDICPVMIVDTNDIDIVRSLEDRVSVIREIRSALGVGTHQPPLMATESVSHASEPVAGVSGMPVVDAGQMTVGGPASRDVTSLLLELMQHVGDISGALAGKSAPESAIAQASQCLNRLAAAIERG